MGPIGAGGERPALAQLQGANLGGAQLQCAHGAGSPRSVGLLDAGPGPNDKDDEDLTSTWPNRRTGVAAIAHHLVREHHPGTAPAVASLVAGVPSCPVLGVHEHETEPISHESRLTSYWDRAPWRCQRGVWRWKWRRRSELLTTLTLEKAMAAPAMTGLSRPAAASGIAAVL